MPAEENKDVYYMEKALREAEEALSEGEIPIGCVIVCKDKVIAVSHNMTERLSDATAHAEMLALTSAMASLQSKYLKECTLYVTVEPCVMCAGAMYWAQIGRVVYGADDDKRGSSMKGNLYHPQTKVEKGVLKERCARLMKDFFKAKRG